MGNYIANQMMFKKPIINSMNMYHGATAAVQEYKSHSKNYCLKLDRILNAENKIYIGIGDEQLDNKQISLQAIRIGDYSNKYYRLLQFTENKNELKYIFEDDVIMTLIQNDNEIILVLTHLNEAKFITTKIDPIIINWFKPINLASNEFDKIYDLCEKVKNYNHSLEN